MRFFADRTTTLLQIFHVIVDGLYDSVPILLSFMIVAFGAQEKDAGGILSVAALLGTLAGLGTKGCSQRFGFLRTLCLITGEAALGRRRHRQPHLVSDDPQGRGPRREDPCLQ